MNIDEIILDMFDGEVQELREGIQRFQESLGTRSVDDLKTLNQALIFSEHTSWAEFAKKMLNQASASLKSGEPNVAKICEIHRVASLTIHLLSEALVQATNIGSEIPKKQASKRGKAAAEALHNKPGGNREKKVAIRAIWASGKYTSRDLCAEEECAGLGMSHSVARKALIGTPKPA